MYNNERKYYEKKRREEAFNKGQNTFEDRRAKAFEQLQEALFKEVGDFFTTTYLPSNPLKVGTAKYEFKTQEEADDVKADMIQWIDKITKEKSGQTIESIPYYEKYGKYKKYAQTAGKRTRKAPKKSRKGKSRKH